MLDRTYKTLLRLLPRSYDATDRREMWETHQRRIARTRSTRGSSAANRQRVMEVMDLALLVARSRIGTVQLDAVLQDLRFGVRSLRRRPLFTLVAVGTLSLGIGATTAIFSVVEGVLLRPLPYERPEELVTVWQTNPEWRANEMLARAWERIPLSQPVFARWQEAQTSFEEVAIYRLSTLTLTGVGEPERVAAGLASSSFFPALGVRPILGRGFLPEEDGAATEPVVLISEELWQQRFGRSHDILGATISLGNQPFTVVGVLPQGFRVRGVGSTRGLWERGVWLPLGLDAESFREDSHWYEAVARLRPEVTSSRVQEETEILLQGEGDTYEHGARIVPRTEAETGEFRMPLFVLLGASLVLLLIACGNVAALLLGEVAGRGHEVATRKALGAGKLRLGQQLLTESLLLGVAGSAFGILLSLAGIRVLLSQAPPIPRLDEVAINGSVLLFSVAGGILTGLVFGMAPAFAAIRGRAQEVLGSGSRIGGGRDTFLRTTVVSGEIALTMVLLVAGGLLTRSLFTLLHVDPGFQQEELVELRVSVPSYRVPEETERRGIYEQMVEALYAVPGVVGVSGTATLPFSGRLNSNSFEIEGREVADGDQMIVAQRRQVMPGFFRTMGIPLLQGRVLTAADREDALPVAIISESMARRYWPNEDPLGARFITHDTVTIVGIVGDVLHESLRAEVQPTFYLPVAQNILTTMSLVIRTAGEPEPLFPRLREAVWRVDPEAPIVRLASAPSLVFRSAQNERFGAVLLVSFAAVAILLAGAGVFGVTARGLERRKQEMGIRMALGAGEVRLVRMEVSRSMWAGALGVSVGLVAALATSRLLREFLFGIESWDPITYAGAGCMLGLLSLVASYLPARRISSVAPMEVLRKE